MKDIRKTARKAVMPALAATAILFAASCAEKACSTMQPTDYVNPYMGNISHLLVPTYPTVHLPNSMLRVYPERDDYTGDRLKGLPVIVTSHRGASAFTLSPTNGNGKAIKPVYHYSYDNEKITPYRYQVYLDEEDIEVDFAPSHQSAIYEIAFNSENKDRYLVLSAKNGGLEAKGNKVYGYQNIDGKTKVYVCMETPAGSTAKIENDGTQTQSAIIQLGKDTRKAVVKYGISFISAEQAEKNMNRELADISGTEALAARGQEIWNNTLSKIEVEGDDKDAMTVFYTSLYRCYERPVNISEDGQYYSAYDGQIHQDNGQPFYVDDWIWDTYRATHPLRVMIDEETENDIINSFLLMADQMGTGWMPTFPEVTGDSRRMNSNHGVATVIDAYKKGLRGFDLEKAYEACRKGIEEKTLIPWSSRKAGWLDEFYKEHGYIPALRPGEKETVEGVSIWEKRQPVAVTLGTAYDQWCLHEIAKELGKQEAADYYAECAYNYRNLFNEDSLFFHPKDKDGNFIEGVDYRYSGGLGTRDYYDENNGWVYRWDVQHNIADLIELMGGNERFTSALDSMFNVPLGMAKWSFYSFLPDHTGNVGMFSMANEPSLHIPYMYNYAGKPYMTQKRIRTLLDQWFRNDVMGVPGDEDGGGMSAFVVFSAMGFYPVTPGMPAYNIGSPMFKRVKMTMSNGKTFEIIAENYSPDNKYIQSATLNGKEWNQPWFSHDDIKDGAVLKLKMGPKANKQWGTASVPPSFGVYGK